MPAAVAAARRRPYRARRRDTEGDMALPSSVLRWTLVARARGGHELLPFSGWIVRGALGRALRAAECRRGCGDGPCTVPAACGYARLFEHGGTAQFRLDASELDGRTMRDGDLAHVRLVTFDEASSAAHADALRRALEDGIGDARLPFEVLSVAPERPDPFARALELGDRLLVELRTPTEIGRGGGWVEEPSPLDILHATLQRFRALGLDASLWPRFEEEVQHHPAWTSPWHGRRWSARRRAWLAMRGARAGFKVRPTPAQAVWFALAETLGVGAGTAFGMGVVRLVREEGG